MMDLHSFKGRYELAVYALCLLCVYEVIHAIVYLMREYCTRAEAGRQAQKQGTVWRNGKPRRKVRRCLVLKEELAVRDSTRGREFMVPQFFQRDAPWHQEQIQFQADMTGTPTISMNGSESEKGGDTPSEISEYDSSTDLPASNPRVTTSSSRAAEERVTTVRPRSLSLGQRREAFKLQRFPYTSVGQDKESYQSSLKRLIKERVPPTMNGRIQDKYNSPSSIIRRFTVGSETSNDSIISDL